ncbi:MAG: FHA domain-containing protein [Clostridium sp.]|nr:FHA domain-containing protein [Clostridium sp.]
MKKVDIVVTKQNDVDVIRYELGAADVYDDRAADKATGLPNVIPFQYSDEDGKRTITSYVKEKMTLEAMYKRTLDKKQVLSILSGLVSVFEIGTQGIPVSYIIKEPSYIYVNEETLAVKCILVAVKQDVMPLAEIPAFFREVVSRIMYNDSDKDNYVAQLLTAINANDFTVSKLKGIVDEQLEAMGLFISRENGLTKMHEAEPQAGQAPTQIKVNKLGVMNNIQNANRQAQMQNMPPMGQPMPQNMPPMGQPTPQPMPMPKPMTPPAGQPMPQAGQPLMGQPTPMPMPMPKPMTPPAGQPMLQPQGQPMPQAGQPPMGQPQPMPMPKPMTPPPAGQPMLQPQGQPMPQAGQPPMGQPQPMPQPKPMTPPPAGQPMPQPQGQPMPQGGQPSMGQPQPMPQPKPMTPSPVGQPMPQPQGQSMPQAGQPPMGQPQPMPQPKPMMPPQPAEMTHGNLVGQMGSKPIPHIVRKKTGEVINITKPEFSIGKSKTKADYAIEDNSAISRVHCIIVQKDGVNYIKDNNSTNHTYLNGVELAPGKEQLLKNKTLIQMGDEEFTFFLRKSE